MRTFSPTALLAAALALGTWTLGVAAQSHDHDQAQAGQHESGAHRHSDAAKLKNPVKVSAESIAAGKQVFESQCVACHGATGKGDGKMAAELNPRPADLTDAEWRNGDTDGEIYTVIRDGAKGTGMRGFGSKLTADQIWNVVNYVRTLSATKSH
jgi:mono/diheme cytochrome c family protein